MDELLRKLTPAKLARWRAYHRRHPFGAYWDWHKAALAPWAAANLNPFRGEDARPVPLSLFIPDPDRKPPAPPPAHRGLGGLAAQAGASVTDVAAYLEAGDALPQPG